jgi:Rrf2 family iron-sulfur cluster assembly transcriptional regulator
MQLSTRSRYAVMAMVDLAARETADRSAELICLADIAHRQQLSQSYLEQLFGKLRRAELVCSARGPGGGYRLARPPGEIAIAEIVAAVEEPIKATRCATGSGGCMMPRAPALDAPALDAPALDATVRDAPVRDARVTDGRMTDGRMTDGLVADGAVAEEAALPAGAAGEGDPTGRRLAEASSLRRSPVAGLSGRGPGLSGEMCRTHDLWSELGHQIALFLCGITLADVVFGRVVGRAVSLAPSGQDGSQVAGDQE